MEGSEVECEFGISEGQGELHGPDDLQLIARRDASGFVSASYHTSSLQANTLQVRSDDDGRRADCGSVKLVRASIVIWRI